MKKVARLLRLICTAITVHISILIFKSISMKEGERTEVSQQPHILFILADDYGWNDIGK